MIERHQKVRLGDEFVETLGNFFHDLGKKAHVAENSSFETVRLIFKEMARIFWKVAGKF